MNREPDLARVAELIGDFSRGKILLALADGRALPASVLARCGSIAPSTASGHLAKLVEGGLLRVETYGRNRYYRLSSPDVASALEHLAALSRTPAGRSQRLARLSWARTCYDHLAGKLGVALMRALLDTGALAGGDGTFRPDEARRDRLSAPGRDTDYTLTGPGRALLTGTLGVEVPRGRRPLIRYCVDWSEQAHHLSGALGACILRRCLDLGWLRVHDGKRFVSVTALGERMLPTRLGLTIPGRD